MYEYVVSGWAGAGEGDDEGKKGFGREEEDWGAWEGWEERKGLLGGGFVEAGLVEGLSCWGLGGWGLGRNGLFNARFVCGFGTC